MMRKLAKLARILRYKEGRRGLVHGVGAALEHEAFLQTCPFATVLDAGANKGQFSLAALCVRPGSRVVAFEPLNGPADRFRRMFAAQERVTLHRIALGSEKGEVPIHIAQRDDSSSLLPITEAQTETFPGTAEVGIAKVSVAPLDAVVDVFSLESPVLLKIDVQGFELELLRGAANSLTGIHDIYCELSFVPLYAGQPLAPVVIAWLAQHGFDMVGVYHIANAADGRAVQADFHFRRR